MLGKETAGDGSPAREPVTALPVNPLIALAMVVVKPLAALFCQPAPNPPMAVRRVKLVSYRATPILSAGDAARGSKDVAGIYQGSTNHPPSSVLPGGTPRKGGLRHG